MILTVLSWDPEDFPSHCEDSYPLKPIPSKYESLDEWRLLVNYIVEDFRASIENALMRRDEIEACVAIIDNDLITFPQRLKNDSEADIRAFDQSICLLEDAETHRSKLIHIKNQLTVEPKNSEIIFHFDEAYDDVYGQSTRHVKIKILSPFAPVKRAYTALSQIGDFNTPKFMSDILRGN